MNTQQRIDDFQGTLVEYIIYLETKVKRLTGHCSPPSPQSDVRDEAAYNSDKRASSSQQLVFIQYEPELDPDTFARPAKRQRKSKPRWQKEMNIMLCSIPTAEDWFLKRSTIGLSSLAEVFVAFDVIIGGRMSSIKPTTVSDHSIAQSESSDAILQLLSSYASAVAALEVGKMFTTQIVSFCQLVFASLCYILVYHGVDKSLVDNVMKICISNSDPKNLDVLRRGARWVNQMISALAVRGLRHLASEIFVLCGQSIAQYGRFADAGEAGSQYFLSKVSISGYDDFESEEFASLPFWIPFFIKRIVGETYSLSDICAALDYSMEFSVEGYSRWFDVYCKRKMPQLPSEAVVRSQAILPKDPRDSLSNDSGIDTEAEVHTSNLDSIELLLAAAERSNNLPLPDQVVLNNRSLIATETLPAEDLLTSGLMLYDKGFDLIYEPDWDLIYEEIRHPLVTR